MTERDQTIKADAGKLPLTLVPLQIIEDIAEIRRYGNEKYKDSESWRRVGIERYRDALFRHFVAYLRDPDGVDEESGIEHYKHMATNMAFLCEMEAERKKRGKEEREQDIRACDKDKQKVSDMRCDNDTSASERSDSILRKVHRLFKSCD